MDTALIITPDREDSFAEKVADRLAKKIQPRFEERPVTAGKAAEHLKISQKHLLKLIRAGEPIPYIKKPGLPYVFFISKLNEYLNKE